ncbi:hypothetical protein [Tenacibaculum sp. SDUM215027]|uniref:hypothetical protein n=1 Tax=Tenacibaculum sp. SDUM215027 TaxID=3422596 RepID=UPI003D31CB33
MEKLTSFRSFKLLSIPQFVEYIIYIILVILIVFIFKSVKKTDEQKGFIISIYKALILGLFGNALLGIIYSCFFALYFIIISPKYEAKVTSTITHITEHRVGKRIRVQYPIFELTDSRGNIFREEGNEGVLGEPIIGEKATIAYQDGKLITISIFSIFIYIVILLISIFVMCVLLYWIFLVF